MRPVLLIMFFSWCCLTAQSLFLVWLCSYRREWFFSPLALLVPCALGAALFGAITSTRQYRRGKPLFAPR